MARQGYPRMAFSACFGGIIFSILWVLGQGGGGAVVVVLGAGAATASLLLGKPWEDPSQGPWDAANLLGACTE